MSDVSTNFAGKPEHQLFGFAAGKWCRLCRSLQDSSVKTKEVLWPITNFEPSTRLENKNFSTLEHFSSHFKDVTFLFASKHTRSQLQKMPLSPLIICSACKMIDFNGHSKLFNHITAFFFLLESQIVGSSCYRL